MNFEYDENKSNLNKSKHGLDFYEAQSLWADPSAFKIPSKQNSHEKRWIVIGMINSKSYTAIITYRGEVIRIISVRSSRKKEKKLYESIANR